MEKQGLGRGSGQAGEKRGSKIITIDGPAGAGKSTVSKILARQLGYFYLDTGAMYRAVAVRAREKGIDPEDDRALARLCRGLSISFRMKGREQRIYCQGKDSTQAIREPEISLLSSKVSTRRPVREAMVLLQRRFGEKGKVVAEGRDMGTVVFPAAEFKFFLDAQPEERARRRYRELLGKGVAVSRGDVEKEMEERDRQDSTRVLAPLRPAEDALRVDSTDLGPEEVAELILKIIQKRSGNQGARGVGSKGKG